MNRLALIASFAVALSGCLDETTRPFGLDADAVADTVANTGDPMDVATDAPADAVLDTDAARDTASDPSADRDAGGDFADSGSFDVTDAGDVFDAADGELVSCLIDGVVGECLPTAACDGESTPGFCPGPADIQCCTPVVIADCSVGGVPGECIDVAECTGDRSPTAGLCPGPAEIQCCTPDDGEACDPDDMPTPNAGLEELSGVGGCPAGMVPVDDFCIDQYEASLVLVLDGGGTEPWSPYHNPGTERVRAVSLPGAVPQGYITGEQAAAACDEAEKRLCTNEEWLRACRGASGTNAYPYGATQVEGWCNENRPVHPVVEYFGTSADWIWSQLGNACINQLPSSLAETGQYDECVSAEEVYDLVGNLHEWTSDATGIFRGGYYVDTWRNGLGCAYRTTAHNRQHWDYSTGFRCCL